jgi:hypothetical protein
MVVGRHTRTVTDKAQQDSKVSRFFSLIISVYCTYRYVGGEDDRFFEIIIMMSPVPSSVKNDLIVQVSMNPNRFD